MKQQGKTESASAKRQLMLVPSGGLGNRMRVMASTAALMQDVRRKHPEVGHTEVVWFKHAGLNTSFSSLFEPLCEPYFVLREGGPVDALFYERPRSSNLFVPRLFQKLLFRRRIYEQVVTPLFRSGFDFAGWVRGGDAYLATYTRYYPYSAEVLRRLFVPVAGLRARIDERCAGYSHHTIGVHVRRTDHAGAIAESPLELFFAYIDAEVKACPDTRIYLATDEEQVKAEMRARYGERLMCSPVEADRTSRAGIEEGVVEMYALSRCHKIYGSFQSSFSEIAAELGGCPLQVVRRGE